LFFLVVRLAWFCCVRSSDASQNHDKGVCGKECCRVWIKAEVYKV